MLLIIDKNLIKNWNQDLNKLKRKIHDNCELEKDIKVEITSHALSKIGKVSFPQRNRKQTIVKLLSQESKQTIVYPHTDPLFLQLHSSHQTTRCADTSHVKVVQAVNPVGGLVSWFWPYPKNGHFPPSSRDIPRGISNHSIAYLGQVVARQRQQQLTHPSYGQHPKICNPLVRDDSKCCTVGLEDSILSKSVKDRHSVMWCSLIVYNYVS